MSKPVIFLAFANDRDEYLPMLNRERKNLYRTLRRHNDAGLVQVETDASATLEDIFEIFNQYDQQVAIFHYGGHAAGTQLQLEARDGSAKAAYAGGLAQLLGQQESLQLVFLNGCATQGQVQRLLQEGVKAVIATSVPVQDKMATEFAEQFYNSLGSHTHIQRAFQVARAFLEAKYKTTEPVKIFRSLELDEGEDKGVLNWGLYVREGEEAALDWALPKNVSQKQTIKTRFDYESRPEVNDILIDIICEDLAEYNSDLDNELNKEDLDIPSIKREIIDSFPTPIGEQLRKLFTRSNNPSTPDDMELFTLNRLEQLVLTYRTSVRLICFTLLSQLWDEKYTQPQIEIGDDYVVDFNSFFTLNKENFSTFNYAKLINTITDIFDEFNIPYFIKELKGVKINLDENEELYEAYVFMNRLAVSFQEDDVQNDQLEALCIEAEEHLGIILKSIAFLVKYKLVTIKNIEIVKNRHETARFRHSQITLNRALTVASTGIAEVGIEFNNFTDNKAVLFIKTSQQEVSAFLNLTPFVIDENALNQDYSSKLFLYAYQENNAYCYQFLNNLQDDVLKIHGQNYSDIKSQFDRFRAEIFGQEYQPASQPKPKSRGSRFSRKR